MPTSSTGNTDLQEHTSAVRLHLKVVGSILEHHEIYTRSRLDAVKSVVLQVFEELHPDDVSLQMLRDVLCWQGTPLVSDEVLRQALNQLYRQDEKLVQVERTHRVYRLKEPPPSRMSSGRAAEIPALLSRAWDRHRGGLLPADLELFNRALALLFARYGCAAYESLTSRNGTDVRIAEVVDSLNLSAEDNELLVASIEEFILSHDPEDAMLKLRLASAYTLLRMNGAGNWDRDELREYFADKRLLVDTNVLFELLAGGTIQTERVFSSLRALGCTFAVGTETKKEFETAIRNSAFHIGDLLDKGIDVQELARSGVVRLDWIRPLLEHGIPFSREQLSAGVDDMLDLLDNTIQSQEIETVHLERDVGGSARQSKLDEIQKCARESRSFEKHDAVAFHDALLWEAVGVAPSLADAVLTMDRSLGRVRESGKRIALMLDEVVTYTLLGGANETEFSQLFSHTLRADLIPASSFLSVEDIQAIASMEARLLTGPPKALRKAAGRISQLRAQKLRSGENLPTDEVGRILIAAIASCDDDRVAAARERDRADAENRRRLETETEAERVKAELAIASTQAEQARRQAVDAEERESRLRADFARATSESVRHRCEAEEQRRVADSARAEQTRSDAANRLKRDWILLAALMVVVGVVAFALGFNFAGIVAGIAAVASLLWTALAQHPPKMKTVAVAVTVVIGLTGLAEKWPVLNAFFFDAPAGSLRSNGPSDASDSHGLDSSPSVLPPPTPPPSGPTALGK